MQLISCHEGRLLTLAEARLGASRGRAFRTGLDAWDALAPDGAFARGAVHELLWEQGTAGPLFVATLLARSTLAPNLPPGAGQDSAPKHSPAGGALIWSDPHRVVYPPAFVMHGIPLEHFYLLRPHPEDQTWAVSECLRCKGVGAVVAAVPRLTRVEARRLQLAAEGGGGAGILLRPAGRGADVYAAATRWLVRPAPGERTTQRWTVQLLHGHGGRIGHTVTLEYSRENHLVRALDPMADRPGVETVARAS